MPQLRDVHFSGANVTAPDGTMYVDVPVATKGMTLIVTLQETVLRIEMSSGWAEGQRGYGFSDVDGGTWLVKRTRSGCCG